MPRKGRDVTVRPQGRIDLAGLSDYKLTKSPYWKYKKYTTLTPLIRRDQFEHGKPLAEQTRPDVFQTKTISFQEICPSPVDRKGSSIK